MDHSELVKYQIGIICALPLELKAVRAILDEEYMVPSVNAYRDNNTYVLGRIHQHEVVLACLPSGVYGTVSVGNVSKDMLWAFPHLRIGLLVGIAGGIPELSQGQDIRLGDVVVSLPERTFGGVVQYDIGKATADGRLERVGSLNKPPLALLTALSVLRSDLVSINTRVADQILRLRESQPGLIDEKYDFPGFDQDQLMCSKCDPSHWWWLLWSLLVWIWPLFRCQICEDGVVKRAARENQDPRVHYGTIASGNSVVKDAALRDRLSRELGAKCVEMEASGVIDNYPCLVIRGICDYADRYKHKRWQEYASLTAAAFSKELLRYVSTSETQLEDPIRQHLKSMEKQVGTLENHIKAAQERRKAKEIRFKEQMYLDCHRAFKTTQYNEAKNAVPEKVPGTCRWVVEHKIFRQWQDSNVNDLLWISADPGCGKSVLARSLIDNELAGSVFHHVCYFFFKDIDERSTLSAALCALIHQMLELETQLLDLAIPVWQKHKTRLVDEIDVLWTLLLTASESSEIRNVTFVLDALDECCDADRKRLVRYLVSFYKKTSVTTNNNPRIKFLVTSRPYDDIRLEFQLPKQFPSIRLKGEEETGSIRLEINLVIKKRVEKLTTDLNLSRQTQERLENELLNMKHRTYLWLHLAVEGIYEDFRDSYCPEEEMINNLPTSVEQAYEDILRRVKDKKKLDVKHILQIVIGAKRSLTIEEIAKALGIAVSFGSRRNPRRVDPQHLEQQIRGWCGLFITIEHTRIYLFHQTAKEFLLRKNTDIPADIDTWKQSLDPIEIDQLMTWICTNYLLSIHVDDDLTNLSKNDRFFDYSARNWSDHARTSNAVTTEEQIAKMVQLFDTSQERFTFWLAYYVSRTKDWKRGLGGDKIFPVAFAAANGLLKLLVEFLRSDGARSLTSTTQALEYASRMGEIQAIQVLLRHGADIKTCQGRALSWAADRGETAVVTLLIELGANVNPGGHQPITQAAIKGYKDIVDLLAAHGADVNANKGQALIQMAARGYMETVRNLIDHGADVDVGRGNAIIESARHGHTEIAKLLFEQKPQTHRILNEVLYAATDGGYIDIVRLVIEYGVRRRAKHLGLYTAAMRGHRDVVNFFLQQDIYLDNDKAQALKMAIQGCHIEVAQILLQHSVDVNYSDGRLLAEAAKVGSMEMVQLLLDYGANVGIVDASYEASKNGHFETARLLRQNGGEFDVWTCDSNLISII